MTRVLLLGDSIRLGYQIEVWNAIGNLVVLFAPVENCLHSGYLRSHLSGWLSDFRPDLVHVNAGLHDLRRDRETGSVQIPLSEYRGNIEAIVGACREDGSRQVVWALTTPVLDRRILSTHGYQMRVNEDVVNYNREAAACMAELSVPVNDLYQVVADADPETLLGADGVHFTDLGSRLLGQAVGDFLQSVL